MRFHLDTDIGSDTDDSCALAMLLGWPEVELVGITTTIDPGGIRAGFVARCLELAGRTDIPDAAGAEVSLTTRQTPGGIPTDARYWPDPVEPRPSPIADAMVLLRESVESGATIVAIGPYTNLATPRARSASFSRVKPRPTRPTTAWRSWAARHAAFPLLMRERGVTRRVTSSDENRA